MKNTVLTVAVVAVLIGLGWYFLVYDVHEPQYTWELHANDWNIIVFTQDHIDAADGSHPSIFFESVMEHLDAVLEVHPDESVLIYTPGDPENNLVEIKAGEEYWINVFVDCILEIG